MSLRQISAPKTDADPFGSYKNCLFDSKNAYFDVDLISIVSDPQVYKQENEVYKSTFFPDLDTASIDYVRSRGVSSVYYPEMKKALDRNEDWPKKNKKLYDSIFTKALLGDLADYTLVSLSQQHIKESPMTALTTEIDKLGLTAFNPVKNMTTEMEYLYKLAKVDSKRAAKFSMKYMTAQDIHRAYYYNMTLPEAFYAFRLQSPEFFLDDSFMVSTTKRKLIGCIKHQDFGWSDKLLMYIATNVQKSMVGVRFGKTQQFSMQDIVAAFEKANKDGFRKLLPVKDIECTGNIRCYMNEKHVKLAMVYLLSEMSISDAIQTPFVSLDLHKSDVPYDELKFLRAQQLFYTHLKDYSDPTLQALFHAFHRTCCIRIQKPEFSIKSIMKEGVNEASEKIEELRLIMKQLRDAKAEELQIASDIKSQWRLIDELERITADSQSAIDLATSTANLSFDSYIENFHNYKSEDDYLQLFHVFGTLNTKLPPLVSSVIAAKKELQNTFDPVLQKIRYLIITPLMHHSKYKKSSPHESKSSVTLMREALDAADAANRKRALLEEYFTQTTRDQMQQLGALHAKHLESEELNNAIVNLLDVRDESRSVVEELLAKNTESTGGSREGINMQQLKDISLKYTKKDKKYRHLETNFKAAQAKARLLKKKYDSVAKEVPSDASTFASGIAEMSGNLRGVLSEIEKIDVTHVREKMVTYEESVKAVNNVLDNLTGKTVSRRLYSGLTDSSGTPITADLITNGVYNQNSALSTAAAYLDALSTKIKAAVDIYTANTDDQDITVNSAITAIKLGAISAKLKDAFGYNFIQSTVSIDALVTGAKGFGLVYAD